MTIPHKRTLLKLTKKPLLPQSLPTPELVVKAFLSRRSPETLKAYQNDLDDFRAFVGSDTKEAAAKQLLTLSSQSAQALALSYKAHLSERQLSPATVNRRLAALRSLVKLARLLGLCTFSLEVENLPDEPYRDTRGPGHEGVKEMFEELKRRRDKKGIRDLALLRLLYDLALRRGEVCSLDLSHVDRKQKTLWVLGKGRQSRQPLTLPAKTFEALTAWIKVRGEEPGPLFLSLDHQTRTERLQSDGLYWIVRTLGKKVGIKTRPHGLRHAAITQALEMTGGNVRAVQKFSRHKDLNVLCRYDDARQDLAGEVSKLVSKST